MGNNPGDGVTGNITEPVNVLLGDRSQHVETVTMSSGGAAEGWKQDYVSKVIRRPDSGVLELNRSGHLQVREGQIKDY